MWVLPSRGRPRNINRLIVAYLETGATTHVWLRLDEDDPTLDAYKALILPSGWTLQTGPRKPLSNIYNEAYGLLQTDWYGFIADDVVPVTPYWDTLLIEAAGSDGMAVPAGGDTTGGCPHFVLGGDLVRSVGWLALPGLDRIYIDTVWRGIAEARNVLRMAPDVLLEHRHFSNGMALFDETYRKYNKVMDKEIYQRWKAQ